MAVPTKLQRLTFNALLSSGRTGRCPQPVSGTGNSRLMAAVDVLMSLPLRKLKLLVGCFV